MKGLIFVGALLWACLPGLGRADGAGFGDYGGLIEVWIEAGRLRMDARIKQSAWADFARQIEADPSDPKALETLATRLVRITDRTGKPISIRGFESRLVSPSPAGQAEPYYALHTEVDWKHGFKTLSVAPGMDLPSKALGMLVLHRGIPVSDRFALKKRVQLQLDEVNPWGSRFDDPSLIRYHEEPRSYLYVEPCEVRHELVLRFSDLAPALAFGLADARYIEPSERNALKEKIGTYLSAKNPLFINGQETKAQLDRIAFLRFTPAGFQPVPDQDRLEAATAVLGVIFVYLTERPAYALKLSWDSFAPGQERRWISLIRGRELHDAYVTRRQPTFEWSYDEMFQSIDPVDLNDEEQGSNVNQIALDLDNEAHRKTLLQALLHNTYRAYQLRDEEAVYDRMAMSLDGELLEETYLQHRRAYVQRERGLSAEGRVETVEISEATPIGESDGTGAAEFRVRWVAHGTISHWGHEHKRDHLYHGVVKLRPSEGQTWKIVGLQFLDGRASHSLGNP